MSETQDLIIQIKELEARVSSLNSEIQIADKRIAALNEILAECKSENANLKRVVARASAILAEVSSSSDNRRTPMTEDVPSKQIRLSKLSTVPFTEFENLAKSVFGKDRGWKKEIADRTEFQLNHIHYWQRRGKAPKTAFAAVERLKGQ